MKTNRKNRKNRHEIGTPVDRRNAEAGQSGAITDSVMPRLAKIRGSRFEDTRNKLGLGGRELNYNQCRKCGCLVEDDKLFSVLYDDPDYVVCETCIYGEDFSD